MSFAMSFTAMSHDGADGQLHVPVMAVEVVKLLSAPNPLVVVDATLGIGGHAAAMLEARPDARLLGIDQDASEVSQAREVFAKFEDRVTFVQANFNRDFRPRCARPALLMPMRFSPTSA